MGDIGERQLILKGAKFDFERITFVGDRGAPVTREIVRHPGAAVVLPLLRAEGGGEGGADGGTGDAADPGSETRPGPGDGGGGGPAGVRVVMIRNRRPVLGRELWELPAGTLEPPEPPRDCAARELEEEAGYRAGRITPIASYYTTPGMTDELMHAFLATDLTPVERRLEEDERIRVELVSIPDALRLLDDAELLDAKSMLAILLALRKGLLPNR